ncbi:MAG: murein biosynthesis integral membrane protein MurJ [Alphaproteobacteria bacterium]|nr:murein biosynthesis integral membrane protein MurJ [Alphaproteobacteria bacterium]
MKLLRSIVTVGIYTMGSRIVGFLRTTLMANFLGAGPMADAAAIAVKIPSLLRRVFAEGAMNAAFVPTFSALLATKGKDEARTYAEEILSILVLILSLIVILAELFMPAFLNLFLPGFRETPERLEYTILFTRLTFPFILLISLTALYGGVLNSLEKFAAVAASPMMGNIAILIVAFILLPLSPTAGHAFSYGILACGVVQWFWVLVPTHKEGMILRLRRPKLTPGVKRFFLLVGPAAAGSGVVQINIFLDMFIASYLPTGGISFLNYAERLNQLPLSMLGTAVGTALLPLLSKQWRLGQNKDAMESQNLALEYAVLFSAPALIALMIFAEPLVKVLYEHGKFTLHDTRETAYTLMALVSGLPAYIMVKIFSTSFFAREDTRTPVYIAVGAVVVNLVLNLLLIKPLAHVGLALSTSIAAWLNAFTLAVMLKRQGLMSMTPRFKAFLPRAALTVILTTAAFWSALPLVHRLVNAGKLSQIVTMTGMVAAGIIVFVGCAVITRALDTSDLRRQLRRKLSPQE